MYQVPEEYFVRLHHCRPRFKNDRENVLLFMAAEICSIGEKKQIDFKNSLNRAIKCYPGNSRKTQKTIDNWRTEISSLLGLIEHTEIGTNKPSKMAIALSEKQDLIEFFRFFAYRFQYPGGHQKPKFTLELIKKGVKFKPAKYMLELLLVATKSKGKFGITKAEATHCIFNDLRVVRDRRKTTEVIDLIEKNRANNIQYDDGGDIVRYAGDILDYMVLANLLKYRPDGKYYLVTHELKVIHSIIKSDIYYPQYENLYNDPHITIEDVNFTQIGWFQYFNEGLDTKIFESDIDDILGLGDSESEPTVFDEIIKGLISKKEKKGAVKTKEIGDVGEALSMHHEKIRLESTARQDLAKKIRKIPEDYSIGYDIHSFDGTAEIPRHIEVKTTISKNKITINRFHMTPNEWNAAAALKESYYVYRLMISGDGADLFIIRDPVGQYKTDNLDMTPRDGVDITYNEKSGSYEEVLK